MTGAGKEKKYTEFKGIRITPDQEKNWNPDKVRNFLDGKTSGENCKIYKNIIKKFIPVFLDLEIDIDFTQKEFKVVKKLYEEVEK
jgi:hypothetical protein